MSFYRRNTYEVDTPYDLWMVKVCIRFSSTFKNIISLCWNNALVWIVMPKLMECFMSNRRTFLHELLACSLWNGNVFHITSDLVSFRVYLRSKYGNSNGSGSLRSGRNWVLATVTHTHTHTPTQAACVQDVGKSKSKKSIVVFRIGTANIEMLSRGMNGKVDTPTNCVDFMLWWLTKITQTDFFLRNGAIAFSSMLFLCFCYRNSFLFLPFLSRSTMLLSSMTQRVTMHLKTFRQRVCVCVRVLFWLPLRPGISSPRFERQMCAYTSIDVWMSIRKQ